LFLLLPKRALSASAESIIILGDRPAFAEAKRRYLGKKGYSGFF